MVSGMPFHGLRAEAGKVRSPAQHFNLERGITNKFNFVILTIHVTFWSRFQESRVNVTNGLKTIRIHMAFFADSEMLC